MENITLHRINVPGKKKKLIISTALITIYAIGACYIFIHSYNMPERIMIMAEKSVKEKNWEKCTDTNRKIYQLGKNQPVDLLLSQPGSVPYGKIALSTIRLPTKTGSQGAILPMEQR